MVEQTDQEYEPDELELLRTLSDMTQDRSRLLRVTGTTTGHRTFAILNVGAHFIVRITDADSGSVGASSVQAEAGLLRKLDDRQAEIVFFTESGEGNLRNRSNAGEVLILSPDTPVIRIRMA